MSNFIFGIVFGNNTLCLKLCGKDSNVVILKRDFMGEHCTADPE